MKKLAVAFVLFLSACGAAPQAEEPAADCSTCSVGQVCYTMDAQEACVPEESAAKLESVTTTLPTPQVSKDICMRILTRCTRRCPQNGSIDCSVGCVDDFIDCVQS